MANKMVYQVSTGESTKQFDSIKSLINYVGFPVSRRDIMNRKHRGITMWEVDEDGNIVEDSFAGLPWADPKYKEDYERLGVDVEGITDEEDEEVEEEVEENTQEEEEDTEDTQEDTPKTKRTIIPVAVAKVNQNPVIEDPEYPERGYFKTEKDIKKYIKKLTDEQLADWCELEGIKWKPSDNQSINRMRMAMAIKSYHGFGLPQGSGKKSKSKYAQYTTEELIKMALDNDVYVRDAKGDPRILRMYAIMALREAGVLE